MSSAAQWARTLWRRARHVLPLRSVRRLAPEDAYRLWSETYDSEADNVLLALERHVFLGCLSDASVAGKVVVDIGCGTGRHWDSLLSRQPCQLHGVDTSAEMLARLRMRYPDARLHRRTGTRIGEFGDGCVDLVVSTLMLGYARDLRDELREWTRLLRLGGEIIVTEFHPEALRQGMMRTFVHRGKTYEIEHERFTVEELRSLFQSLHLEIVCFLERTLDESVRASFERQNHTDAYFKGFGIPLVLGFRLRRAR
jgi:ubiquinone/menaquinone biosynthesis C-methylase UbiE